MEEAWFQGKDSSDDEDLLDVPDDDQYDTEDSFIDDAELVGIFGFFLVYLSLSWPFIAKTGIVLFCMMGLLFLYFFLMLLNFSLCRMNILRLIILQSNMMDSL